MSLRNLLKEPIRVLLSRHGQAFCNLPEEERQGIHSYIPGENDALTPQGEEEAVILGNFLNTYHISPENPSCSDVVIATSAESRSRETGEIVASRLVIPFCRIYSSPLFNEQMTKELCNLPKEPTVEEFRRYLGFPTNRQVHNVVSSELEYIIKAHEPRLVVAVLHGNINAIFLKYAGLEPLAMGNCSLLPLKYREGRFEKAGDYLTNSQMKDFLDDR
jgi:broad specificity phosphatase PhoE